MDPDSDPDSAIFIIDLQDANKNRILVLHLHHFSKKKSKRCHKPVKSRVFLLFLLNDRRIRIQEAPKHGESGESGSATMPET
jgi:hypothetical protein